MQTKKRFDQNDQVLRILKNVSHNGLSFVFSCRIDAWRYIFSLNRGSDRPVCWTVIDNCKLQWKQDCSDNIFDHLKEGKVFEEGKLEMTAAS